MFDDISIPYQYTFAGINEDYLESLEEKYDSKDTPEFRPKEIKDFKKLDDFENVEEFDKYVSDYVQGCLDTGGGTAAIQCLITSDLWDRELNIIYKKLYKLLDKEEKAKLKKAQKAWLINRDLSIEFTSDLLYKEYPIAGTMYYLIRANHTDRLIAPIVKNRVITLRKWLESANQRTN